LFEIKLIGLRAFKYYTSTPHFVINKKYIKKIKTKRRDGKNKVRKYIKSDQSTQYNEVQKLCLEASCKLLTTPFNQS